MSTSANPPLASVPGIESLVLFSAQIFQIFYGIFHHPTAPVPTSAVPQLTAAAVATPGMTPEHATVATAAIAQAAATVPAA